MINYKYWSIAMRGDGYDSLTLVSNCYEIYDHSDFDLYYSDIVPKYLQISEKMVLNVFGPIFSFMYAVKNAKILNFSFLGGFLGGTPLWFLESFLYRTAGIKAVVSAFGGDYYMYSKVLDLSLRHGLLMSYPEMAKKEPAIQQKINYWTRDADVVLNGFQMDGMGRWDCLPVNMICLDDSKIYLDREYQTDNDSEVMVVHAPNHRGYKGTEFIIEAVEALQAEGYRIKFVLIEKMKNTEVLEVLKQADILVEQIINGYALNAMEGMASGAAVLSNLSNDYHLALRRYSYLDECPILSTTPETIRENLVLLIENPDLRSELGRLGVQYVEKYHSERTSRYMYGKIFRTLTGESGDEDLINMFHPKLSEYCKDGYIDTPLTNNLYLQ